MPPILQYALTHRWRSLALALVIASLAGCATQQRSGSLYRAGEAQREQVVRMATIESVRAVTLDRGQTGVGTGAGAAIGGIAGSSLGRGKGAALGAVAGAVAGGIVGQAVEGSASKVPALEITVRLDDGSLRAIVQEEDGQRFRPGDRVRLLSSQGITRVTR